MSTVIGHHRELTADTDVKADAAPGVSTFRFFSSAGCFFSHLAMLLASDLNGSASLVHAVIKDVDEDPARLSVKLVKLVSLEVVVVEVKEIL